MSKYDLRLKARALRSKGKSVKTISNELGVAKSTASVWVRDIVLNEDQMKALKQAEIKGAALGRLRGSLVQKNRRLSLVNQYREEGRRMISSVTRDELFLIGLGLYWSEGSKKNGRLEFCNSDPKMIQCLLLWLKVCFNIPKRQIKCRVGINEAHKGRDAIVKAYWSKATRIPLTQFVKTSFKKVRNQKVYDNFEDHYGTLTVNVAKPGELYYKILGLIEGLSSARLDSSAVEQSFHKR